jgi:hypothetical protein
VVVPGFQPVLSKTRMVTQAFVMYAQELPVRVSVTAVVHQTGASNSLWIWEMGQNTHSFPNRNGAAIRAAALTAESAPITAPLCVFGTHCISRMGTAGVNRGMPQTYTAAAAMAWVSQVAAPTPNSPHETIVSPSAAVNVSPTFSCTLENTNADMAKESAAKLVNVAPILVTPISSVPAAYTAVVKEKGQSFECVLVIYS